MEYGGVIFGSHLKTLSVLITKQTLFFSCLLGENDFPYSHIYFYEVKKLNKQLVNNCSVTFMWEALIA